MGTDRARAAVLWAGIRMKWVYFIKPVGTDGPVKIGATYYPKRRLPASERGAVPSGTIESPANKCTRGVARSHCRELPRNGGICSTGQRAIVESAACLDPTPDPFFEQAAPLGVFAAGTYGSITCKSCSAPICTHPDAIYSGVILSPSPARDAAGGHLGRVSDPSPCHDTRPSSPEVKPC
jgi:hypothetical protein